MEELLRPIKRALISVSDKTGIAEFAKELAARGVELLSTGGTCALLKSHGLKVTEVADYTGFPEMMDGRVKTLHPKIHGGLLGRRGIDDAVMAAHGIGPIDLLVVNLYPFGKTVARPECTLEEAVENIDIGGPAMVRAAAKNHRDVAVVVRARDYARVLAEMAANKGCLSFKTRFDLAVAAFEHTAAYDGAIANYFGTKVPDYGSSQDEGASQAPGSSDTPAGLTLPRTLNLSFIKRQHLRYGENPHQSAAFYVEDPAPEGSLANARQLQGKELSYNNLADTDAALSCVAQFDEPACVIVKHANPCGAALGSDLNAAYEAAFACDRESAFGGILAFNRALDAATAAAIVQNQFCEVIIAPEVPEDTLAVLARKPNIRVLASGSLQGGSS